VNGLTFGIALNTAGIEPVGTYADEMNVKRGTTTKATEFADSGSM
jgi:hypothetical protein